MKLTAAVPAVLKATTDFEARIDGVPTLVLKGSTALEGSWIHNAYPDNFR